MTPVSKIEKYANEIVLDLDEDNLSIAKELYDTRVKTLDDEEKKILDLYINTKIKYTTRMWMEMANDIKSGFVEVKNMITETTAENCVQHAKINSTMEIIKNKVFGKG